MGCWLSMVARGSVRPVENEDEEVQVSLSAESRRMIRQSWREIQEDISRVGIIMFCKLFETHPESKGAYCVFRDMDDLKTLKSSKELRAHCLSVMSFIEKTVARIDQDERLRELILDLGKKHFQYNALPKYYEFVGAEFIRAVQPILKERWSSDLEEAWKTLFLYISSTMKRGFHQAQRNQNHTCESSS